MKYLPPVIEKMYREKSLDDLDFFAMTNCLDWSQQGDDDLVLEPLIQYFMVKQAENIKKFTMILIRRMEEG